MNDDTKAMEPLVEKLMDELRRAQPLPPNPSTVSRKRVLICGGCGKTWTREAGPGENVGDFTIQCRECSQKERTERFTKICPPLYRYSDRERLPQKQLAEALNFKIGPKGLLLTGPTGVCKTRVAWLVLKNCYVNHGVEFDWFDAVSFGHKLTVAYREERAERFLDGVSRKPLVFFDDLGKLKLTERAEAELFGVIEKRCAGELPIIASTNDTGESLADRMTNNRGDAMIRRIREFCHVINFNSQNVSA